MIVSDGQGQCSVGKVKLQSLNGALCLVLTSNKKNWPTAILLPLVNLSSITGLCIYFGTKCTEKMYSFYQLAFIIFNVVLWSKAAYYVNQMMP